MTQIQVLLLAGGGLFSGILAGFLGIGGGTVLVPLLVTLGYSPVESVATSSLAILMTSISGSIQNWRMGFFSFKRVLYIGLPAIFTAQIGALLADWVPDYILLVTFGLLLWLNIYLVQLRKKITQDVEAARHETTNPMMARLFTGSAAGFLAGFFGVGGGVIMVPLQILLLGETIKTSIQTSLGVIVITAVSACIGHALRGNVLLLEGLLLGLGGLLGAQISTRFLPKLPDETITIAFRTLLGLLSIYIFVQAWMSYNG